MLMVVPVQAISLGGSTTCRVEVRELGPAFRRNTVPGWTGPWTLTDLTSGFQDGHWSSVEITANTVCGSAAICSSPSGGPTASDDRPTDMSCKEPRGSGPLTSTHP
jgi:hypothetical protein